MTTIIILNWNGWKDTQECIESLSKAKGDFKVLVVDNGSTDDSVDRITEYVKNIRNLIIEVYETGCNYGFAKGNNEAVRYIAEKWDTENYLLLNNDTIVEPDFLVNLENFGIKNPEYKVLTPVICYNSDRDLVWNCGGWQRLGFRKYYYANQSISDIREIDSETGLVLTTHKDVSFLTGCALFFKRELLDGECRVFTEDFFFGEEDFEFCMRMNKIQVKMACVMDAKIYHKVSSATSQKNPKGKIYIHYLNRCIDIRTRKGGLFYFFWCTISFFYAVLLLKRQNYGVANSVGIIVKAMYKAIFKTDVTYLDFQKALSSY